MEQQYLDLCNDVLKNGDDRIDRTQVGTRSLFGHQIRCDLEKGFPLITTKQTHFKPILGEILWFVEGSSDERRLAEITYGTRDPERTTIWTQNAQADYWRDKREFDGDLGRVYGVQWRDWTHAELKGSNDSLSHPLGGTTYYGAKVLVQKFDQLKTIVETIKKDPASRRMVLSAFNVGEMNNMALPPCHMFAQFHVNARTDKLSCQVYIRSNDLFLGLPFNIASYAILTQMIAQVTGKGLGELIITIGDAHIYKNHFDQVREQNQRAILAPPKLIINPAVTDIDHFEMTDFSLEGYQSHPSIKAPMAV
jgi:thymidylate synthase